jgi:hypothetical protein
VYSDSDTGLSRETERGRACAGVDFVATPTMGLLRHATAGLGAIIGDKVRGGSGREASAAPRHGGVVCLGRGRDNVRHFCP